MVIFSMLVAPLAMIALLMLAFPAPAAAVIPASGYQTATFTFVPRSLLP